MKKILAAVLALPLVMPASESLARPDGAVKENRADAESLLPSKSGFSERSWDEEGGSLERRDSYLALKARRDELGINMDDIQKVGDASKRLKSPANTASVLHRDMDDQLRALAKWSAPDPVTVVYISALFHAKSVARHPAELEDKAKIGLLDALITYGSDRWAQESYNFIRDNLDKTSLYDLMKETQRNFKVYRGN